MGRGSWSPLPGRGSPDPNAAFTIMVATAAGPCMWVQAISKKNSTTFSLHQPPETLNCMKMPKNITVEVRDVILKVKDFMDTEKKMQTPIIPLNKVYVRVAAACGVSERTVLNVVKEAKLIEQGLLDPMARKTPKKRVRTKGKIEVNDYELSVLHRKIHEFYTYKKEVPTVNKLLNILREEVNFKGSRETLRKILRKHGFQFRKTKTVKIPKTEPVVEVPTMQPPPPVHNPMPPPPPCHNMMTPVVTPYMHSVFGHKPTF